jgi:hypothetical protein
VLPLVALPPRAGSTPQDQDQHGEHRRALDATERAQEAEEDEEQARGHHQSRVAAEGFLVADGRVDQSRDAQHEQDVRDVAAHDVADGNVRVTREDRAERDAELGRRRAEGHHGEAHHEWRNARSSGQGHGATHQEIAAEQEIGQAPEELDVHHRA